MVDQQRRGRGPGRVIGGAVGGAMAPSQPGRNDPFAPGRRHPASFQQFLQQQGGPAAAGDKMPGGKMGAGFSPAAFAAPEPGMMKGKSFAQDFGNPVFNQQTVMAPSAPPSSWVGTAAPSYNDLVAQGVPPDQAALMAQGYQVDNSAAGFGGNAFTK